MKPRLRNVVLTLCVLPLGVHSLLAQEPAAVPVAQPPEWKPTDPALVRDLKMMQGTWERLTWNEAGEVTMRQEKVVEGNKETLTNMDRHGNVTRRHSARFRLEKHGAVHVISFYRHTSFSGGTPGRSHATDFAYLYRVDESVLLDAPGMFISRRTYQRDPSIYIWRRVKTK